MPALIRKCTGATLVKMLLFSFNISDLHAAKKGGGGGSLKCMCDLCDCVTSGNNESQFQP